MNTRNLFLFAAFSSAIAITSCGGDKQNEESLRGVDRSAMDTTVKPGDDFFQYANGGWVKNTEIPASEGAWGAFAVLRDQNQDKLKTILTEAAAKTGAEKGSSEQLIGDYYYSAMDTVKIDADGLTPLKEGLDLISGMKSKDDFVNVVAYLHSHFTFAPFGGFVGQDPKRSDLMIMNLFQGGNSLPDKDYYTRPDPSSQELRDKFLKHVENVFVLMGETPESATKKAKTSFKIENMLAAGQMNVIEQRDLQAQYNKMNLDGLQKLCPEFDWKKYFEKIGITNLDSVIVGQPKFFSELSKMIKSVPLEDWKIYFSFGFVDDNSVALSKKFEEERFEFYGKTMSGAKEMKPRWKRSIEATDRAVGDALGKAFVDKHFTAEAKKRVNEMVDNLTAAYKDRIKNLDWMSDVTKVQANTKLDKIMRKLGYPDKWKEYTGLEITRESFAKNRLASNAYEHKRMINKLGKPVDKTEWGMTPPTINAYYNPSMNEIVFPAGIMQYPFFDMTQDDALNYGGMGAVIGHELTHGFDDQGCQFNGEGNMVNWWTKEDSIKFAAKTKMVVDQFNGFVAMDTLHVRGELTLGENIADLGGLTISYYAYMKSLEGKEKKVIDGFTPEQRFFFGWAKVWCVKYTDPFLKQQVLTNPHSPGNFRVNGPVSNLKEFYDAFNVKEGDAMWRKPEDRAAIW